MERPLDRFPSGSGGPPRSVPSSPPASGRSERDRRRRSPSRMSLAEVRERTEDERLIAAVGLGDEAALAALYDRHASAMLGVAYRVLRNRTDAEDLVHDVFVESWNKARDFQPSRGTLRSWLLMRVRSRGIDRLRSLEAARRHAMAAAREEAGAAGARTP